MKSLILFSFLISLTILGCSMSGLVRPSEYPKMFNDVKTVGVIIEDPKVAIEMVDQRGSSTPVRKFFYKKPYLRNIDASYFTNNTFIFENYYMKFPDEVKRNIHHPTFPDIQINIDISILKQALSQVIAEHGFTLKFVENMKDNNCDMFITISVTGGPYFKNAHFHKDTKTGNYSCDQCPFTDLFPKLLKAHLIDKYGFDGLKMKNYFYMEYFSNQIAFDSGIHTWINNRIVFGDISLMSALDNKPNFKKLPSTSLDSTDPFQKDKYQLCFNNLVNIIAKRVDERLDLINEYRPHIK